MAIFIIFSATYSIAEEIPCVAGSCNGWSVGYNGGTSDSIMLFKFMNQTGGDAFNIVAIINFYDYMGKYLGRFSQKHDGPIHQYLPVQVRPPKNAFKMTAEIYYKKEY